MSQTQLDTASRLTSLRPVQRVPTKLPTPRPTSIALKATPAPAMGPEDELLFDPDEESYGNAGPGGGYVVDGTNNPLGYQQNSTIQSTPVPTTAATRTITEPPMLIDLSDREETPPPAQTKFMSGAVFWILLILGIVTSSLCLLYFARRSPDAGMPPPPSSSFGQDFGGGGGFGGDPAGSLGGNLGGGLDGLY